MSLLTKYRPKVLKRFAGNNSVKESLNSILTRETDLVQFFLFSGPSGCGKTTLAKIIQRKLKISDRDSNYYNAANTRGLDTIRDVIENCKFSPLDGDRRLFIFDECLAKGTKINTPQSSVNIEHINPGDEVFNIEGRCKVKNVFQNKVDLPRVVKVNLSKGKSVFCSEDHLFLTSEGWVEAKDLKNILLLVSNCDNMFNTTSQKELKNESLQGMPKAVAENTKGNFLFKQLLRQMEKQKLQRIFSCLFFLRERIHKQSSKFKDLLGLQKPKKKVQRMRRTVCCKQSEGSTLFQVLRRKMEKQTREFQESSIHETKEQKSKYGKKEVQSNRKREKINKEILRKNENKQPHAYERGKRKSKRGQTIERFFAYLERKAWGKWAIYATPDSLGYCFGMGNGSSNFFGQTSERLPNLLQSRHGTQGTKNSNRNRWEKPLIEKEFIKRQEKDKETKSIRVESVEIYQRGSNDKSFSGVISNKERDSGFVTFYDLEIEGHPSYFANDLAVHNCHQITGPAQEALLLILENPPPHVIFVFCTTEPEKLKETIKNRASHLQVRTLRRDEMSKLLAYVCKRESAELPRKVVSKIIKFSNGSPRRALSLLDSIIDVGDEDTALQIIMDSTAGEKNIAVICRTLLDSKQSGSNKWGICSKILDNYDGDAEQARRGILNYFTKVQLGKSHSEELNSFLENFQTDTCQYHGKAFLIWATYRSCFP